MLPCISESSTTGLVLKTKSLPPLKIVECIGEGGFSTVYKARSDSKYFAVKRIKQRRAFQDIRLWFVNWKKRRGMDSYERRKFTNISLKEVNKEEILKEISILRLFQHKYSLEFFDSFSKLGSYWLVTEYCICSAADLSNSRSGPAPLIPCLVISHLVIPMFAAVAHLNSKGYMHLDVKSDNILVSSLGVPKLADFGLAEEYPGEPVKVVHRHGTAEFMAPEMYLKESYSFSYDTWSLGMTMVDLFYGPMGETIGPEFKPRSDDRQLKIEEFIMIPQWKDKYALDQYGEEWVEIAQFLRKIMKLDWRARPTPSQVTQLSLAAKVLESWENRENSELFQKSSDALWERIETHVGRDANTSPSQWSEIASGKRGLMKKCLRLLQLA